MMVALLYGVSWALTIPATWAWAFITAPVRRVEDRQRGLRASYDFWWELRYDASSDASQRDVAERMMAELKERLREYGR